MVELPFRKEGKPVRSLGPILFFVLTGALLVLYLFGNAIQEQGIPTDINMVLFLIIIGIAVWIMAFLVSMLSPDRPGRLGADDWVILIIAGLGVIALLIFFPGLVPASFKSAVFELNSFLGIG